MNLLKYAEQQLIAKTNVPDFKAGDTVTVNYKIKEGDKERVQQFTGVVIQIHGDGNVKTFTVRKISNGVGVERIFPLYSPFIESIKVERKGEVRRAKLFYLRGAIGKKAKIDELKEDGSALPATGIPKVIGTTVEPELA
ncbi:MAG: 50S ribosomal protein L19 [Bacteroidota bacterium]